jgi:hypothetical protein
VKEIFEIKIGTKKKKVLIQLSKGKTMWHTGKYTLMIAKMKWLDSLNEWGMYWWTFIPIGGKRIGKVQGRKTLKAKG